MSSILPRASTLTLFLRLYEVDIFIHGIGGGNYEWVNDRIIERFYNEEPPYYAVLSGTFYINDLRERRYPFFFYDPGRVRDTLLKALPDINMVKTQN